MFGKICVLGRQLNDEIIRTKTVIGEKTNFYEELKENLGILMNLEIYKTLIILKHMTEKFSPIKKM